MKFIEVRSAKGPATPYRVSEAAYKAWPEAYVKISGAKPRSRSTAPAVKKATRVARKDER